MKNGRYNIYINQMRAKKFDRIYEHLKAIGVIGLEDEPTKNLALMIDYALNIALEEVKHKLGG